MTRFLSLALGAPEPNFRQSLNRYEQAHGYPSHDIRLTAKVSHQTRAKLAELGLDPNDTTPHELYLALQHRVMQDDQRLTKFLRARAASHVTAEADVVDGMIHTLEQLSESKHCFALKISVLKRLLKKLPPKKAMRALGYRSLESFVKHESAILILTAAWLVESEGWRDKFLDQYKLLTAADFENRTINLVYAKSKRWQNLANQIVSTEHHNLLAFKELGAVVFLPLGQDYPQGSVLASLSLALHELNEIRATSAFLKLCQFRSDFGQQLRQAVVSQAELHSSLLDQPVSWHLVQKFFARMTDQFHDEVFEPYLEASDMAWHSVEGTLAAIDPDLQFWQQTSHLGMLDGHQPVSMNVVDAAINLCNQLPYASRLSHYFKRSLWQELMMRYLRHQPVEETVLAELQPEYDSDKVLM